MGKASLGVAVLALAVAGIGAYQASRPAPERGAQLEISDMSVIGDAEVRAQFEDMSMPELGVEDGHVSGDGHVGSTSATNYHGRLVNRRLTHSPALRLRLASSAG